MSAFRDGVGRLVARTEKQVVSLFGRYERGEIGRGSFVALAATVIASARAQGVALADLALTAEVIRALGPTRPVGLRPPGSDLDRLHTSVSHVLDQDIDYAQDREMLHASQRTRLGRLARDSAAEAAVFGFLTGARERGLRGGWTRETDMDPCKVCSNLADGVVRSWNVTMKRHTGCACVPRPAF